MEIIKEIRILRYSTGFEVYCCGKSIIQTSPAGRGKAADAARIAQAALQSVGIEAPIVGPLDMVAPRGRPAKEESGGEFLAPGERRNPVTGLIEEAP